MSQKERPANSPESNPARRTEHNAPHNLNTECDDHDQDEAPPREQGEADFGAEAHGFTGYEKVNKGSKFDPRSEDSD